jgi:hypothetical protein
VNDQPYLCAIPGTFRGATAVTSYRIGSEITDLFGRPSFEVEVKLRGRSDAP